MGRFSFLTSLSGTKLLQSLQKLCAEKGFPSSLHYAVTRGKASTTKPTFRPFLKRAFLPPQLPQPLLSTFVRNRAIYYTAAVQSFSAVQGSDLSGSHCPHRECCLDFAQICRRVTYHTWHGSGTVSYLYFIFSRFRQSCGVPA